MKINHFFLLLFVAAFIGCDNSFDPEEEFDLEILPGYVAFDAPGNDAFMDDVAVSESDGSTDLVIETPTGTLSDVTINYSFGGSAVFGEDFSVAGASASGGTIVLVTKPSDIFFNDRVDLTVDLLTDGVVDGEKTLTITLESASNAEGDVAVGRGGLDFLKTATVVIADVDE
ncbi:MAG: hypothetical protein AAGJ18_22430 [Bacteroidota bacterium]